MAEVEFGRYRLLELLGRGGMGDVWRAQDSLTDNRIVAVKILPAHLAADKVYQQRFRREAQAAAHLNNPHVVPIHGYGEIDGRLYVDMRLIEGRDLKEVLAEGPLEPSRAVRIVEQMAKALHAAHKAGLVHRDVKPSNILLDEDDYAYLIDFGIARAAGQAGLTGTGKAIGTWHYMAPERFSAREADARADIYALACVLYECLTGSQPFPGDSLEQQYGGHVATPPPRPSTTQPAVPEAFDEVIATGMAKDPRERYATTVDLARAAQGAITTPISRPEPVPGPSPTPAPPTVPVALPTSTDHQPVPPTVGVFPPPRTPPRTPAGVPTPRAPERPPPRTPPRPPAGAPTWRPPERPPPRTPPRPPPDIPTWRPPERPPTPAPPPISRPWWRRRSVVVSVGVVLSVVAAVVAVTLVVAGNDRVPIPPDTQAPTPSAPPAPTRSAAPELTTQTVLPFTGVSDPQGVAVDSAGSVYVTEEDKNRVMKLAAGSSTPTLLPFDGLNAPRAVAVDGSGSVYVTDSANNRVVKLPVGSTTPTVLPFTGLTYPSGVAVDGSGSVYVTDSANNRVVKLAAGSTAQTVLPFTGVGYPTGVTVDAGGSVYVADRDNARVVKLAAGSTAPTVLPFAGLDYPWGVTVDSWGGVYVASAANDRVVKLAAGATRQIELPFTGLYAPTGVAVDGAGSVYVADSKEVVKLAAA